MPSGTDVIKVPNTMPMLMHTRTQEHVYSSSPGGTLPTLCKFGSG